MKIRCVLAVVALLFLGGLPVSAELRQREWTIDGVARTALVWTPTMATNAAAPLVFVFHGHGGSMRNAARSFRIHELWPEAVVVYMQGLPTPGKLTDPNGRRNGWQSDAGAQGDRDLKFFDAVLHDLSKECNIDANRTYCTGHSNGGAFTYLLWAERGDVFAAVAPSSALSIGAAPKLKPKPALHVAGENDALVNYAWQERMMQVVKKLNSCSEAGEPWASDGDLTGTLYPSKTGTPLVTLIHPGSHTLPREAPALIVRFFKEHAKRIGL